MDGWFGLGEKAEEFELQTAKALGKDFGVFVNSGSSANLVALLTIRELFKDKTSSSRNKVIVPASSFPTTVNPIIQLGFEPLFVDVELGSYAPVYDQVMEALERHDVIGMMFAHPLGNPVAQTKEYYEKLNEVGGFLIEDCCDCLGGKYLGVPVGTYSHVATLSTYMAHHITSGEGGMVCFNRKKHQRIAKSFRDWGHAEDYVEAMWLMLQQDKPGDYVCSTGVSHSVKDLVEYVVNSLGLDCSKYVSVDEKYLRPEELKHLKGDCSKIKKDLGWSPNYNFESMMDEMIEYWVEYYEK